MSVPVLEEVCAWQALEPHAKRDRVLRVAAEVFTREGLDATMPAVAVAAGAGVASLYRQFGSKQELLAALVVARLERVAAEARLATVRAGSRWEALRGFLMTIVEQQACDEFFGEALARVEECPSVADAMADTWSALDELLASAHAEGRLRDDAGLVDLQLVFAATRAARHVTPAGPHRLLALLVDGLAARS